MKKLKIRLLALFPTFSFNSLAQTGPTVPVCTDCELYTQKIVPFNGLWYNPEQSGVGMSIEVRKYTLFGVYYGYDDEGESTWYTFTGTLVESDESGLMWNVSAPLVHFRDGTCINCNYQAPESTDTSMMISLKIKQKNYISFSINDGDEQNIVPLDFARPLITVFPNITSYRFPDLWGQWVFIYNINIGEPQLPDLYGRPHMLSITPGYVRNNDDGTKEIKYFLYEFESLGHFIQVGNIICNTNLDKQNNIVGPTCKFKNVIFYGPPEGAEIFNFSLGGIGPNNLFGESDAGHTFEAFRVTKVLRDEQTP